MGLSRDAHGRLKRKSFAGKRSVHVVITTVCAIALLYFTQPRYNTFAVPPQVPAAVLRPHKPRHVSSRYTEELYLEDFRKELKVLQSHDASDDEAEASSLPVPVTAIVFPDGTPRERMEKLASSCEDVGTKYVLRGGNISSSQEDLLHLKSSTYIFQYNAYMKYAHMAMVAQWGSRLIAAWQASPARPDIFDGPENMIVEGLPEQRIMYSFSSDVGNKWSAPFTVPQQKKASPGGPDSRPSSTEHLPTSWQERAYKS
ncbi:hypothetical protein CYMTET_30552 [Cymbomonas tetramitiformis]|uniref:Uncharacterized protein n=1 Tax=Cymbomonas tetramitiformis TaxID=36881 RepID=A0AAE0KTT5_9CHLO|nr:hypothetical protein CYMTET_30552 [Cymbomonas tetramitiformis]